ncbi:MAG: hypothetical protein ACR2NZ_25055 [Rubripirellula sp.]
MPKRRESESAGETAQRDYGFIAIVALAGLVAIWLLLMPWVPSVASHVLKRFQLQTPSFIGWAMQFPIPSMYNCANECKVQSLPPGLADPVIDDGWRHVNHFPARIITFADGRYHHLLPREDRWFRLKSSYRGQTLESTIHLEPIGKRGRFRLIRLSSKEMRG